MSTSASRADNPGSCKHLPVVVYFDGDLPSQAVLTGMHRFLCVPWRRAPASHEAGLVLVTSREQSLARYWAELRGDSNLRIIALSDERFHDPRLDGSVYAYMPAITAAPLVERMIDNALDHIHLTGMRQEFNRRLAAADAEIDELNQIGAALSAEHEIPKLLEMILTKSRQITRAEAGSLYLVEDGAENDVTVQDSSNHPVRERYLRFALAQNDRMALPFREAKIEISRTSIAGCVALTGETVTLQDAYAPCPGVPYTFNRHFDEESGYRTQSILCVPMRDPKKQVVGVLQLINSRTEFAVGTNGSADKSGEVIPFTAHHCELIESLASQAAVALENSRLVAALERSFEGFVRASVVAIEERDPTTCGHSSRVASLTLGLADAVNRETSGAFAATKFTPDQLKEIRYASLLHDFGKVGVREEVLVKATKLYPAQLERLQHRFIFAKRTLESEMLRALIEHLLANGVDGYQDESLSLAASLERQWAELDYFWDSVQQANIPTVNPDGEFGELAKIAERSYTAIDGSRQPLLDEGEVRLLSIRKGSLDENERAQIEAHATTTFRFLNQIPWTNEVRGIPLIARAHHEKLNGTGYPQGLSGSDIPLQARMIAIADIYDGLTAFDRPYKKAASPEQAVAILQAAAADGEIDPDLFRLFVEARVWKAGSGA
jgi:HD-GYP domain-containing protein (c-di-GMP phosphodiesterase class II)